MADSQNFKEAGEIRKHGTAELRSMLSSRLDELQKIKFKHALGQLRETHKLRAIKREIARLKTLLIEKVAQEQ